MKPSFVPFAPPSGASGQAVPDSFQLTVLPQASQAVPFVPTTPTTTHACAAPPSRGGAAASPETGGAAGPDGPEVTYEREGDRVTRIRIRCGCGQVLELNLAY